MDNGEEICRSSRLSSGEESDHSDHSRHILDNNGWPGADGAISEIFLFPSNNRHSSPKTFAWTDRTESYHIACTHLRIRHSCPRENGRGESQVHH